jgi:hypothetical protein
MSIRTFLGLVCVLGSTVLLVYRIRQIRGRWRNPKMWSVWASVFFFALAELFSVPENALWMRAVTGVPNLARLLTYTCICATAASFLSLALSWRYPARVAWSRVRWVLVIYGLAIATLVTLFELSSVPEERPIDFPTHYAGQPTVTALMTVMIVAAASAFTTIACWCFSWARSADFAGLPWLRWGLRLYGSLATDFATWLTLTLLLVVAAHWFDSGPLGAV